MQVRNRIGKNKPRRSKHLRQLALCIHLAPDGLPNPATVPRHHAASCKRGCKRDPLRGKHPQPDTAKPEVSHESYGRLIAGNPAAAQFLQVRNPCQACRPQNRQPLSFQTSCAALARPRFCKFWRFSGQMLCAPFPCAYERRPGREYRGTSHCAQKAPARQNSRSTLCRQRKRLLHCRHRPQDGRADRSIQLASLCIRRQGTGQCCG